MRPVLIAFDAQPIRRGRRPHASRPENHAGGNLLFSSDESVLEDLVDGHVRAHVDALCFERIARVVRKPFGKACKNAGPRLEQNDARLPWIGAAKLRRKRSPGEFGNRAGEFDSRRTAPDDDDGEQSLALDRIDAHFSAFEGEKQPAADERRV